MEVYIEVCNNNVNDVMNELFLIDDMEYEIGSTLNWFIKGVRVYTEYIDQMKIALENIRRCNFLCYKEEIVA